MKTPHEIVAYLQGGDPLGFKTSALIQFVPFEIARPLLKDGCVASDWPAAKPLTEEAILGAMRSYMEFAWEKARDHRGLSAGRSIHKMQAWCWLLGNEGLVRLCDSNSLYPPYGAPILKAICDRYGFPIPEDGRTNRMAAGLSCQDGCEEGCEG